jgi:hypothetical protein
MFSVAYFISIEADFGPTHAERSPQSGFVQTALWETEIFQSNIARHQIYGEIALSEKCQVTLTASPEQTGERERGH